jgi:hypothetical protein
MSIDDTIVASAIFILWQIVAIGVGLFKGRKTKIPRRCFVIFVVCGSMLALLRVLAYWYLSYRNQNHTSFANIRFLHFLYLFSLPESSFVETFLRLVPWHNTSFSIVTLHGALIVGSFFWTFPLVIWLTPKLHPSGRVDE